MILYIKNELNDKCTVLKYDKYDIIWILIDKKYTNADYNMIMCFCYNLPENPWHSEASDQDIFSKIKDGIVFFKSIYGDECKFYIVGDLNARVGEMNDFIENDDVLSCSTRRLHYGWTVYWNQGK